MNAKETDLYEKRTEQFNGLESETATFLFGLSVTLTLRVAVSPHVISIFQTALFVFSLLALAWLIVNKNIHINPNQTAEIFGGEVRNSHAAVTRRNERNGSAAVDCPAA